MGTGFPPAERSSRTDLSREIEIVSHNPVMDGLLRSVAGLLAVLDEHRQILAVNDSLLQTLGIADVREVLGLRPGEAIQCIHAREEPGGCGTTKYCSTCGAAIAIVASLAQDTPAERLCAATVERNGHRLDICFQVRAFPIRMEGHRFLLLFLQDITTQHRWAAVERVFFHDLNNILTGLVANTELLELRGIDPNLITPMDQMLRRLKTEIEIQRALSSSKSENYQLSVQEVELAHVVAEVQAIFAIHQVAEGKRFVLRHPIPPGRIHTDCALLVRILTNMLTNAFEATEIGGQAELWIEQEAPSTSFCVGNRQVIPADIQVRIFQKHFTTKEGPGRGVGTYSMKLFGEEFLKGRVSFTTTEAEGTVFRLTLRTDAPAGL